MADLFIPVPALVYCQPYTRGMHWCVGCFFRFMALVDGKRGMYFVHVEQITIQITEDVVIVRAN